MGATKAITNAELQNTPVFWFVRLENARERQDHETAARALQQLRRLGITVRFTGSKGVTR